MAFLGFAPGRNKSSTSIRHYCLLGCAASLGFILAQEGTPIPVNSREPQKVTSPQTNVLNYSLSSRPEQDLVWVAFSSARPTAGTHVPLPEADLESIQRVSLDSLDSLAREQLPFPTR